MNYFLDVVKNKYAQFDGRATRSEYWYFTLFFMIGYILLFIIDAFLMQMTGLPLPILTLIFALGLVIPSIAVAIRRLHDIGKSGWWYLLAIVPIVSLVLIAFFVMDSKEDNQYGPNPKA